MSQKKAFSFFLWFLYSIAVCVSLFWIAGNLCRQAGYPQAAGFAGSGVWLLLCGLLVFLLHGLVQKSNGFWESGSIRAHVAEGVIAVILLGAGIAFRVSGLDGAGQDAAYYELAMVAEGQTIPPVVHGATYVYLQLLHVIYVIFGNRFFAGIWLQIVLQMIACVFLYAAVRKQTQAVAALVALGFVMAEPAMVREALTLSPRMLLLAVYAVAAYVCVRCISGQKRLAGCVVCGVLISCVCYLDIVGVTLLFMTVAGLLCKNEEEENPFARRLVCGLCCVLACAAGFVLLELIDSLASSKGLLSVMGAWWSLFAPSGFTMPVMTDEMQNAASLLVLVLVMSFGIFSYWRNSRKEGFRIWILAGLMLVLMQCFGMTTAEVGGYPYLYVLAAILAGVGVAAMFTKDTESMMDERLGAELEAMSRDIIEEENSGKEETLAADSNVEAQVEPPKVKLIENPLPLPRKHVKKVLDFDIEPDEGQGDFDVRVEENDDYDI